MKQSICELNRLAAFLEGTLSAQQELELVSHLDNCSSCAEELEQLAAVPSRWQDVQIQLSRPKKNNGSLPEFDGNDQELPFTIRQVIGMLDPTDDPKSMGRIGGYEVAGVVGSGAMGVVLKAFDQTLDRVVALKVMNPTLAACGTARHRFAREAKAAAAVLHPNVIAIHGVSTDRELPFLVMPYIAGMSLQQRLDRQGPLEVIETLRIGSQIAAGLAAAHQVGLIHRDIKPSNVMLDEGVETALITDFGLARTIDDATMTRSGAITGTPEYMSPEQARGESVDCASDIFSLGSVLYTLCTGKRPFRAKTPFGVLRRITDEQPRPIREKNPEVPIWLCKLIEKMHSKSPGERPGSSQIRELLEGGLAHVYQPDRIPLPSELSDRQSQVVSSRTFLVGAVLTMSLFFIAILAIAMQPSQTNPEVSTEGSVSTREVNLPNEPDVYKTLKMKFPQGSKKGILNVDINRGFIEVAGHDGPEVIIEVLSPPKRKKSSKNANQLTEIFAPKYDLDRDEEKNMIKLDTYNQDFVLNVRIKVPYETDLTLDTYRDGHLEVKNVTGTIDAHSQHCDIRLLEIAGSATAYSRNGNLTVRFKEVDSDANLDFESYNGTIDLSLPRSIEATTAISSGRGKFLSAFKIGSIDEDERPQTILDKVKRNVEEYQFGEINSGGIPLRIECENGLIKIRKSEMLKIK